MVRSAYNRTTLCRYVVTIDSPDHTTLLDFHHFRHTTGMKLTTLTTTLLTLLTTTTTATPTTSKRSGTPLSQSEAARRPTSAGITSVSSGSCTDRTNSRYTSYQGLLSGTVSGAITLKGACNCELVITGGTETGHASGTYSHANGYKLDFRKNAALNGYITGSFERIANRGDGYPQWRAASGNVYCDEGDHWDVLYY
ncbi:hypothetical protein CLAFUW4_12390 [Fulvia fulva]|uniref:Uncharacterized protein n=1 Tax=Passalora fulva TaxID=5499 RepID=A0A9Q8PE00_PASFU|nr:uncharacterized protein CLAFUR5_11419 [Fulvia fulva]KAK4617516.1 hypothetical protein CLAFUR4_12395 [Fulvia fulva]KAK4619053.1 hypothetical protein CLAFUR0_12406 [Fulvia fulva]UJO20733.1 hypothetical protein CLAFUR5_11419 [Fulvia fulva]WPV17815.1 hypothetical protein CLAFUW4_12390 [Fulvia fulva]WPV33070.1 hypothetical protein CLAFUW7_12397 [Fulvia fulva]